MKIPPPPWISDPEALRGVFARTRPMIAGYATGLLGLGLLSKGVSLVGYFFLFFVFLPSFWLSLRVICEIAWDTSYKGTTRWLRYRARPDSVLLSVALASLPILALHVALCIIIYLAALRNEIGYAGLPIAVSVPLFYLMITFVSVVVIYFPILVLIDGLFSFLRVYVPQSETWETSLQHRPSGIQRHTFLEWLTLAGVLCTAVPFLAYILASNRIDIHLPYVAIVLRSIFWSGIFLLVVSAIWRIVRSVQQQTRRLWRAIFRSNAEK